jgi:membrane protease YdiL (CAAX protease family)
VSFARRQPTAFFVIAAFVITYLLGPLAFFGLRALQRLLGTSVHGVNDLVMKFGPSLAGLLAVVVVSGATGLRALLQRLLRWRFSPWLYLFAVLVPPALLGCVLVARGQQAELTAVTLPGALGVFFVQLLLSTLLGGGLGEEVGWRGVLQPQLSKTRSPLVASLLVAVAWLAWHVPAYVFLGKGEEDPFWPFALVVFPFSVVLTWITQRSGGSLLAPVLLHGSINAAFYSMIELSPVTTARADFQPGFDWLTAGAWCLVAIAVVASSGSSLGKKEDETWQRP